MPLRFDSPLLLTIALLVVASTVVATIVRRIDVTPSALWLAGFGVLLLAVACGSPRWSARGRGEIAVMVDLSPSTRGAAYRDRATLERRVRELVGGAPHRLIAFGEANRDLPDDPTKLPDLPAERTRFAPPADAQAVVLFSDARFEQSDFLPPTFVVVDPLLENPPDASVDRLDVREDARVSAQITNGGADRRLTWEGVADASDEPAPAGGPYALVRRMASGATLVRARLSQLSWDSQTRASNTGADLWPENDSLSIRPPPPKFAERWFVSATSQSLPDGWHALAPADLPTDPADYLRPSAIVLHNVAATDLSALQESRIEQFARDLGGGVVILGGDRAFAAGGYPGTALDAISPLASTPPAPATQWILLVDSSGSMSGESSGVGGPGSSRWKLAVDAMTQALAGLPPEDVVTIGSFAQDVRWWSVGKSVRETTRLGAAPSPDIVPRGPTNLAPALKQVAESASDAMPNELLVLSDFEAKVDDPDTLAAALKAKRVRVHALVTGQGENAAVERIVETTGGTRVKQSDPLGWASAVRRLARQASPDRLNQTGVAVRYTSELNNELVTIAPPSNRTWLKDRAQELAHVEGGKNAEAIPMAAQWQLGAGRVTAVAFGENGRRLERLTSRVNRAPTDPRFRVTWATGSALKVTVDATGNDGAPLNGLSFTLEVQPGGLARVVPQTAPGRYDLSLSPATSPREPALATLRQDGRAVDRAALAGRYPSEFDAIGNDHDAMRELASHTGGAIVEPARAAPLDFRWPRRSASMLTPLALLGAIFVALALIRWRIG